jgi:thiazole synthase ThiGH ThiG subunit
MTNRFTAADPLIIAGQTYTSRLILGTGGTPSLRVSATSCTSLAPN